LPEAFVDGIAITLGKSHERQSFLNGEYSLIGFDEFFPYALLVKTPLSLFVLAAAALGWALYRRNLSRALYRSAPLWSLLLVYWAQALQTQLNIGFRHVLLTLPVLAILAGGAVRWAGPRPRLAGGLIGIALTTFLAECALTHPHYLAYFNPLAGGPSGGYRHLVDSSLDWGQDLPGLRKWLQEQDLADDPERPVYLSYFGSADPRRYGIRAIPLPSYETWGRGSRPSVPARPGIYCVSATMLQNLYTISWGRYSEELEEHYQELRSYFSKHDPGAVPPGTDPHEFFEDRRLFETLQFSRLKTFLRQTEPIGVIGHTIFIYDLDADALARALHGPPREIHPDHGIRGLDQKLLPGPPGDSHGR
jgi:hypothetical protein